MSQGWCVPWKPEPNTVRARTGSQKPTTAPRRDPCARSLALSPGMDGWRGSGWQREWDIWRRYPNNAAGLNGDHMMGSVCLLSQCGRLGRVNFWKGGWTVNYEIISKGDRVSVLWGPWKLSLWLMNYRLIEFWKGVCVMIEKTDEGFTIWRKEF